MNIFISHSGKDSDFARTLRTKLDKAGLKVLDPQNDHSAGDNLALAVGKALERADAMVFLMSPDAAHSEWIRLELEYALGNARFKGRVVPVLVKPTNELPWILNRLSIVDVTRDDPPRAVNKVMQAVNAIGKAA